MNHKQEQSRYEGRDISNQTSAIPNLEETKVTNEYHTINEQPFPPGTYDERVYKQKNHPPKA
jgi:hypothetical protein